MTTILDNDSEVLNMTEHEMPPTLEVLRKYDDMEYRRRSATLRIDSTSASMDSHTSNSNSRSRDSGINRLLRSNSCSSSLDSIGSAILSLPPTPFSSENPNLQWKQVVLKMTSFSEEDVVTSFRFGVEGGTIGRASHPSTDEGTIQVHASIPADKTMAEFAHARLLYLQGLFYLVNGDVDNSGTYIRLSPTITKTNTREKEKEEDKMQWPLDVNVVFRAGKSDYQVTFFDETTSCLHLQVLSGKLSGQTFVIGREGGGIGRSTENVIHTSDGELSRQHCRIWFDTLTNRFYLLDLGSTNGTFMKLIGPYDEPYRLEIGDDLLISQTCLSVHHLDYGVAASMGARKHMEDAHTIVQDLNIPVLTRLQLFPQCFFGVFDGHGGAEASRFVHQVLHQNIIHAFRSFDIVEREEEEKLFKRIQERLIDAFEQTDRDFLTHSDRPQAGSTATTVFIAGNVAFIVNVGDSRTILSRQGIAVRLSNDHKPSRPDEAQRIREMGGFVIHGRIMGELAVSRAFGDAPFKSFEAVEPSPPPPPPQAEKRGGGGGKRREEGQEETPHSEYDSQELPVNPHDILKGPLVIATPEITQIRLTEHDEFILLASDGLYDVLKDQQVIDFMRHKLNEGGDVQRSVEAIVDHAITNQRSMDNVTVIVIMLRDGTSSTVPPCIQDASPEK